MQCLNIGFYNMDSSFVMTTHKKAKYLFFETNNVINSCFK